MMDSVSIMFPDWFAVERFRVRTIEGHDGTRTNQGTACLIVFPGWFAVVRFRVRTIEGHGGTRTTMAGLEPIREQRV
jgi:hypothetical protein